MRCCPQQPGVVAVWADTGIVGGRVQQSANVSLTARHSYLNIKFQLITNA